MDLYSLMTDYVFEQFCQSRRDPGGFSDLSGIDIPLSRLHSIPDNPGVSRPRFQRDSAGTVFLGVNDQFYLQIS